MKNPPWGNGGRSGVDSNSIASGEPCPWPCLYNDKHEALQDRTGYTLGTECQQCGQFISRAEWLAELNSLHAKGQRELR